MSAARRLERVLCVEDDADIQRILQVSLGRLGGYSVRSCTDPLQAFAAAREFQPDLILLDYMMPGLTGPEVFAQMRVDAELSRIPVMFLTASATREQAEQLRALGSAGVLFKPFNVRELPDQLRTIWNGLRPAAG